LWYRCYSYNILQEHYDNEPELIDECIEDNYDLQQIHINSMLNNVSDDKIQVAWHVVKLTVSYGIVCQHYFAVLLESNYGKSYGLLQTVLTLAMEMKTDEEQKKELLKADTASSQDHENIIQVINPKVMPVKGHQVEDRRVYLNEKLKNH
ncbi:9569_t:CDS:2, partial [Cetraspora pellucida]